MMINWIDPKKIPPTLKGSYLILLESDDNRGMGIFIATFRSKKDCPRYGGSPKEDVFISVGPGNCNFKGGIIGESKNNRFIAHKQFTSRGIPTKEVIFYSHLSEFKIPTQQNINPLPHPLTNSVILQKIDITELEEQIHEIRIHIDTLEKNFERYNSLVNQLTHKIKTIQSEFSSAKSEISSTNDLYLVEIKNSIAKMQTLIPRISEVERFFTQYKQLFTWLENNRHAMADLKDYTSLQFKDLQFRIQILEGKNK